MSGQNASDAEIVSSCLAGKPGAWEAFVRRFSRLIYWTIHRSLESQGKFDRHDLVDDIYQEVFGALLQKEEIARLAKARNVRRFLCAMTAYRAFDRLKSLRRSEGRLMAIDDADPGFLSLPALPMAREKNELIGRALDSLNAKERFCVELHFFDEMPHRHIAELLGVPQDTISSLIRRIKEKLKERFLDAGLKDYS